MVVKYKDFEFSSVKEAIEFKRELDKEENIVHYIGGPYNKKNINSKKSYIKNPSNRNKKWKKEDDKALLEYYNDSGYSISKIAKLLGRTKDSIRTRINLKTKKENTNKQKNKSVFKNNGLCIKCKERPLFLKPDGKYSPMCNVCLEKYRKYHREWKRNKKLEQNK